MSRPSKRKNRSFDLSGRKPDTRELFRGLLIGHRGRLPIQCCEFARERTRRCLFEQQGDCCSSGLAASLFCGAVGSIGGGGLGRSHVLND